MQAIPATDQRWMQEALRLARLAAALNEVPVGAVVVHDNHIIGRGYNSAISRVDPVAHAEVRALRDAAATLDNYRLTDCDLYVTLEPCTMCAGAIVHSRIRRLVYGATEPGAGAVTSQARLLDMPWLNHVVTVTGGVLKEECSQLLSDFFCRRRLEKKQASQQDCCY